MYEKRLTDRLTSYWQKLRQEQPMPPFQKLNPGALSDIWEYCMLLTVNDPKSSSPTYSYYQLGDKVRNLYGSDMEGRHFSPNQKSSRSAKIVKRVDEILSNPQPLFDNGQFVNEKHKVVKYRSCLLPFGQNNEVTHIIVGLSWREFG